jgi:hypothetical protein
MIKTAKVVKFLQEEVSTMRPLLARAEDMLGLTPPEFQLAMQPRLDAINNAMASMLKRVKAQGPFVDSTDVESVIAAEVVPVVAALDRLLAELRDRVAS